MSFQEIDEAPFEKKILPLFVISTFITACVFPLESNSHPIKGYIGENAVKNFEKSSINEFDNEINEVHNQAICFCALYIKI